MNKKHEIFSAVGVNGTVGPGMCRTIEFIKFERSSVNWPIEQLWVQVEFTTTGPTTY